MRRDLLKTIAAERDITSMFVLTHNIDFLFIETLLLAAIRHCGRPTLTIFADGECAAQSYSAQKPFITALGRRYRVAPVSMAPGFRFHPKAILLSGTNSATLLVGSGNLTFGGWQNNAELWCRFTANDGLPQIASFRQYLEEVLNRVPLNEPIRSEWADAFSPTTRAWAGSLSQSDGLIGRCGAGQSFEESFRERLKARRVEEVTILSPYFDPGAEAVRRVATAAGSGEVRLLVPRERSNLTQSAFDSLSGRVGMASTTGAKREDSEAKPFVHAKAIAFRTGDEVLLFAGSANCSHAAILKDGALGNAELMTAQFMTREEFEGVILSELEFTDEPPTLPVIQEVLEQRDGDGRPRVVAARLQHGKLRVAFSGFLEDETLSCVVDGVPMSIHRTSPSTGELDAPIGCRSILLQADRYGKVLQTESFWVDDEVSLAVTSAHRSLEGTLGRRASIAKPWELKEWQEVVKALCADLEYLPATHVGPVRPPPDRKKPRRFSESDAFPDKMPWPLHTPAGPHIDGTSTADSLERLLSNWFLRAVGEDAAEKAEADVFAPDEDAVDQQVHLGGSKRTQQSPKAPSPQPLDAKDRKRAGQLLVQIVKAITSIPYLEQRHPADMARDIKLAGLVIRLAWSRGWLDPAQIVDATSKAWLALFVADEGGAVGKRIEADAVATKQYLAVPAVSAALFGWALQLPSLPTTPAESQARFILAMAVAWHPWLFAVADLEAVGPQLALLLQAAPQQDGTVDASTRWERLVTLGRTLVRLEACLRLQSIAEWNHQTEWKDLGAGELVWQGPAGYLVTLAPCSRGSGNVECASVESRTQKRIMKSSLLNPVRALVGLGAVASQLDATDIASVDDMLASARTMAPSPKP